MVRWRSGTVRAIRREWRGAAELDVVTADGDELRALAYVELVGTPEPGDRVLLNVGALVMGLGTGGYALVVALPDRLPADPPSNHPATALDRTEGSPSDHPATTLDRTEGSLHDGTTRDYGHLVKARYTPLQTIRLGVDEEASPHRTVMAAATSLDGMPVVTADLHSAL
ncbi:MAG TPA: DUF3866 family protein, partial [Actinoplanes sp.]